MKYILDTDTLIYFFKGNLNIIERLSRVVEDQVYTTIINCSELFFGACNSERKKDNLRKVHFFIEKIKILPFCIDSSLIFAELKAQLKQQGKMIADMDLMIASIVMQNEGTLVTNNLRHFSRLKKLKIENWSCSS